MSKRLMVLVLLALLVSINVVSAQETTAAIDPALAEQMAELEKVTQNLRGLTEKTPVEHKFPTRQETIDYLRATYDREFPREAFDRLERFYVALDLLPADVDLQAVYLNLLNSQVAGFYDPDTETMNVIPAVGNDVGASLSFTEQVIYVHEFTHALQDQYFDLNSLMTPEIQSLPDQSLAVAALVEGDATATMTLYTQEVTTRNPLAALSMLIEGAQAGNLSLPAGIPPILVSELLFPNTHGMNFILPLYKRGGWDAINGAYGQPPTTSEQVLHPEKYLAGEAAQAVTLDDTSAALGAGWSEVWASALGEFYLRAHLATRLSSDEAEAAAAGWGGDQFRIYTDGTQTAWALRLSWDSFADSQEFNEAYVRFGDARFNGSTDESGCWQNSSGALCLILTSEVPESLIVSAPTAAQAKALAGM